MPHLIFVQPEPFKRKLFLAQTLDFRTFQPFCKFVYVLYLSCQFQPYKSDMKKSLLILKKVLDRYI